MRSVPRSPGGMSPFRSGAGVRSWRHSDVSAAVTLLTKKRTSPTSPEGGGQPFTRPTGSTMFAPMRRGEPLNTARLGFRNVNWWIASVLALLTLMTVFVLVLPAIQGRRWAIPRKSELHWVHGHFSRKLSTRTSYRFIKSDGSNVFLRCAPAASSRFSDCLDASNPSIFDAGQNITVGYYEAPGTLLSTRVIMAVATPGLQVLSLQDGYRSLVGEAAAADEIIWVTLFLRLGGAVFMAVIVFQKIVPLLFQPE